MIFKANSYETEVALTEIKSYNSRYERIIYVLKKIGNFDKTVLLHCDDLSTACVIDKDNKKFLFSIHPYKYPSDKIETYNIKVIADGKVELLCFLDEKKLKTISTGIINDNSELSICVDKFNALESIHIFFDDIEYVFNLCPSYKDMKIDIEKIKDNFDKKKSFINFYNIIKENINIKNFQYTSFLVKKDGEVIGRISFKFGNMTEYEFTNEKENMKEKIYLEDDKIIKEQLITSEVNIDELDENTKIFFKEYKKEDK